MEFIIPVRFTGHIPYHMSADNLKDAVGKVMEKAKGYFRYDKNLPVSELEACAPTLMLSEQELPAWPYWAYGYRGTDGIDWRVHYTREGRNSIPDYAEEIYPVTADWIPSWQEDAAPKAKSPEAIEGFVRKLMQENRHNLKDGSDKYAQGYQDALRDALAAMGAKVTSERFD